MCIKLHTTRRFCEKCGMVTSWKIDKKIGHSRCMVCNATSKYSRRPIKRIYEEPKMNKQYVKEQIDIAIRDIEAKYDSIIGNIYQCPDCGALAFRNSEHVCLAGKIPVEMPTAAKKQLLDYLLEALPTVAPDPSQIFESDSPYLPGAIGAAVVERGYTGLAESVGKNIAIHLAKSNGLIKRVPVAIRVKGKTKGGKSFEKIDTSFAYWRSA